MDHTLDRANTDPVLDEINGVADYGVVGDLFSVASQLTQEVVARRGGA
ncbi:electron transfer flavoprotein subunit alpha [Streptomyces canus]